MRWEHFALQTPGSALSLVIRARPWVPPSIRGPGGGPHAPSTSLDNSRAQVGEPVQRAGGLRSSLLSKRYSSPLNAR